MFKRTHILRAAGLCIVALHTAIIAAAAQRPPAELQDRVAWLSQHTSPIRSVDPADDNFSDLEPIGRAIGGSRVVLLGEQSHGDGTVFLAKTRLIRYLHEKLGFDVVAFECSLFDTRVAWDSMKSGEDPVTAFRRGVYGIWSRSEQLLPLIDYLGARAKTERPLELSGFDCHFNYSASQGKFTFTIDLLDFLAACRIDASRIAAGKDARLVLDSLVASRWNVARRPTEPQQRGFFDAWTAVRQQVDAVDEAGPDVSLWKQLMKSVEAHARYTFVLDSGSWAAFNGRDEQMAANLVWLVQERFKGRKIIVWAASIHNARSLNSVDTQRPAFDPAFSYEGAIPMGEHVWQTLGKDMYSIGFVASEGSFGNWRMEPQTLPPVNPKSLEGLWAQTGAKLAFVDFRGLRPDEWLRTRLVAGPFGYGPMLADWTKVFDGMIFTRVMEKSRRAER